MFLSAFLILFVSLSVLVALQVSVFKKRFLSAWPFQTNAVAPVICMRKDSWGTNVTCLLPALTLCGRSYPRAVVSIPGLWSPSPGRGLNPWAMGSTPGPCAQSLGCGLHPWAVGSVPGPWAPSVGRGLRPWAAGAVPGPWAPSLGRGFIPWAWASSVGRGRRPWATGSVPGPGRSRVQLACHNY